MARKTAPTPESVKRITISLPPSVHEKAKAVAARHDLMLSTWIARAVTRAYAQLRKEER